MERELSEANRELLRIIKDLTPEEVGAVEAGIAAKDVPPPARWPLPAPEQPKVALKKEEQLMFDREIGLMLPVPTPVIDSHRLVYRNRTRVEEQLPGLEISKHAANRLRLPSPNSDH